MVEIKEYPLIRRIQRGGGERVKKSGGMKEGKRSRYEGRCVAAIWIRKDEQKVEIKEHPLVRKTQR